MRRIIIIISTIITVPMCSFISMGKEQRRKTALRCGGLKCLNLKDETIIRAVVSFTASNANTYHKVPVHFMTQSCDPISCYGKPVELTKQIITRPIS